MAVAKKAKKDVVAEVTIETSSKKHGKKKTKAPAQLETSGLTLSIDNAILSSTYAACGID